ncbi:putative RNA-binding protein, partial [Lachnellula suecica]
SRLLNLITNISKHCKNTMPKEIPSKKRKASVAESGAEKVKKIKKVTVEEVSVKKRKAIDDVAVPEVKKSKVVSIVSKPKVEQPAKATPAKAAKKPTSSEKVEKKKDDGDSKASKVTKNGTGAPKQSIPEPKAQEPEPIPSSDDVEDESDDEDDEDDASEIDDQTEALLEDFASDGDEEDAKKDGGLPAGQEVPKLTKAQKKKLKQAVESELSDKPGVVYIGHIPHGFYEHEMREYFKQFGTILKLRLSRNPKTGASKHFAFIQFESATVASIVSKTMDNYLLFGHILKVKVVPDEQVSENLFKGANKRFKKVPWNKLEGRKLKQAASEATWEKRIEVAEKKRVEKADKLKAIGYEFNSPKIKSAKGIAKPPPALADAEKVETKAIEDTPVAGELTKSQKKKEKKQKAKDFEVETKVIEAVPAANEPEKAKKVKKSKSTEAVKAAVSAPVSEVIEKEQQVQKRKVVAGGEVDRVKVKKQKKSKKLLTT